MEKNFDELVKTIGNLANMQNSDLLETATANMGSSVLNDIEMCFENEKSPDGSKWEQRKDEKNQNKLLFKSGDLANSWQIKSDKEGFFVFNNRGKSNGFSYGLSHQFGSKNNIPKRAFLPIEGDKIDNAKLDKNTQEKIKKELENTIKKALGFK